MFLTLCELPLGALKRKTQKRLSWLYGTILVPRAHSQVTSRLHKPSPNRENRGGPSSKGKQHPRQKRMQSILRVKIHLHFLWVYCFFNKINFHHSYVWSILIIHPKLGIAVTLQYLPLSILWSVILGGILKGRGTSLLPSAITC